jgi:hypothetical protein
MVGELEIIFGKDPVARLLCVARQRLVFFEQLGRVAARTIVDAVARVARPSVTLSAAVLALTAPAATATGLLTIVDQVVVRPCLKWKM